MSIKAKKMEGTVGKWKWVERICLGMYVLVALCSGSSFMNFFRVMSEKETMQRQAQSEINEIKAMYQTYNHQQRKYLDEASEQIANYCASRQQYEKHDALFDYVHGIGTDLNSWKEKAEVLVSLSDDKELKEIESRIVSWNLFDVASLASDLREKDSKAWNDMEKKIARLGSDHQLIPVISGGTNSPYILEGMAKFDLGSPVEPKFSKMVQGTDDISLLGIIVYVIINALVLLNYLVVSRTNYVTPSRSSDIGGLEL